jgi:hypothetical protein
MVFKSVGVMLFAAWQGLLFQSVECAYVIGDKMKQM